MISTTFVALLAFAASAIATPYDALAPGTLASLTRRDFGEVLVSCSSPSSGSGTTSGTTGSAVKKCICPIDLNGDTGVLINYFPGYQCAYKGGACTWADISGELQNTRQTNCPTNAPCNGSGCQCPIDNNGDTGVLINEFKGYQCAYHGGACTWDNSGALSNIHQTNCPTQAKCTTA